MDKTLAQDNFISTLRTTLISLGTVLATMGVVKDADWQLYSGIGLNLVTLGWILWSNYKARDKVVSAIQTGQAMPNVQGEKEITAALNRGQIVVPDKPKETP